MSNDDFALLRHRVKGTLQQVDTAFDLIESLEAKDPAEAQALKEELALAMESLASQIRHCSASKIL